METPNLEKQHWQKAMLDNTNLILQCKMQIIMAEEIIVLIEKKLAAFPEEKQKV